MGALPKRKTSKSRKGERQSHLSHRPPQLALCPQCRSLRLAHHACSNCGYYKGRAAVTIPSPTQRSGGFG